MYPVIFVTGIIGLILGIVLLVAFLPAKNRVQYYGAAKWFYDFLNFHKYLISGLIKVISIIVYTICFFGGLICLFLNAPYGLTLIVSGVVFRIFMEVIMITLNIRDNVAHIADAVSRAPGALNTPAQPFNPPAPGYPQQNAANVCPICGASTDPGAKYCLKCGSALR